MPPECKSAFTRWIYDVCYCPPGYFYKLVEDERTDDSRLECPVHSLDTWGVAWILYMIIAFLAFAVMLMCSIWRLYMWGRDPYLRLQRSVHKLSSLACILRLIHLASWLYVQVHPHASNVAFWNYVTSVSRNSFFSVAGLASLYTCWHWHHLLCLLEVSLDHRYFDQVLYGAGITFIVVEVVYDIWRAFAWNFVLTLIYFLWLSSASIGVAVYGLKTAAQLYRSLRQWIPDSTNEFFKKTLAMAAMVSTMAMGVVTLSFIQTAFGRFYAWPCMTCLALTRIVEVAYLVAIQASVSAKERPPVGGREVAGTSFTSLSGESGMTPANTGHWSRSDRGSVQSSVEVSSLPGLRSSTGQVTAGLIQGGLDGGPLAPVVSWNDDHEMADAEAHRGEETTELQS